MKKIILALVVSLPLYADTPFMKSQKACISASLAFASKGKPVTESDIIQESIKFCEDALLVELNTDHESLKKISAHSELYGCVIGVMYLTKANNKDMTREMMNQTAANFCGKRH